MQTFQCRRYIFKNFNFFPKNMKKTLLMIAPNFFFSFANRSKTSQPKSHFLFHKNVFLRDFYIMTLLRTYHPDIYTVLSNQKKSTTINCCRRTTGLGTSWITFGKFCSMFPSLFLVSLEGVFQNSITHHTSFEIKKLELGS